MLGDVPGVLAEPWRISPGDDEDAAAERVGSFAMFSSCFDAGGFGSTSMGSLSMRVLLNCIGDAEGSCGGDITIHSSKSLPGASTALGSPASIEPPVTYQHVIG